MGHVTLRYRCAKCQTEQEQTLSWTKLPGPLPVADDRSKALVTCRTCGHRQLVPVWKGRRTTASLSASR